jgi:hypothetical protein
MGLSMHDISDVRHKSPIDILPVFNIAKSVVLFVC